jgi:hypothetical protein
LQCRGIIPQRNPPGSEPRQLFAVRGGFKIMRMPASVSCSGHQLNR